MSLPPPVQQVHLLLLALLESTKKENPFKSLSPSHAVLQADSVEGIGVFFNTAV